MKPNQCKAARMYAGFSQHDLSKVSGVSRAAIARYELGTNDMRDENKQKIIDALLESGV